jgi:hypothetical protein
VRGSALVLLSAVALEGGQVVADMCWWYLSFVHADRAEGDGFVGACVVQAPNELMAVITAWNREINPGGEVALISLGDEATPEFIEQWCYRLLNRGEAQSLPHPRYWKGNRDV